MTLEGSFQIKNWLPGETCETGQHMEERGSGEEYRKGQKTEARSQRTACGGEWQAV